MKVLVDTSCWIAAFRNKESFEASIIESLLKEDRAVISSLVLSELLQGAHTQHEFQILENSLKTIPLIKGIDELSTQVGRLSYHLKKKGFQIATLDIVLAALAIHHRIALYTLDKHFKWISKHSSLVLFEPMKQ